MGQTVLLHLVHKRFGRAVCNAYAKHRRPDIYGEQLCVLDKPLLRVFYAFVAQKNDNPLDIISTAVVALTNERILIGRKRVVMGYFLDSITPDMFNDLKILSGIIWGKVYIDYVKEFVTLSNISKDALSEIETKISSFMMEQKKKYGFKNNNFSE